MISATEVSCPAGRVALRRLSALCGMAAPVFFTGILIVVTRLNPAYSSARQRISELGAPHAPHAVVLNTLGLGVTGLLVVAFSLGLWDELRNFRAAAMGTVLIGVAGIAVTLAGAFPCGVDGLESSAIAVAHGVFARIGEIAVIGAALALWLGLRGPARWKGFSRLSLAIAAAALALYTLYQFESLSPWNGLLQRSIILVVFLWIEIIAIRLMSLAGRPGARPGPAESPQAHGPWTA